MYVPKLLVAFGTALVFEHLCMVPHKYVFDRPVGEVDVEVPQASGGVRALNGGIQVAR